MNSHLFTSMPVQIRKATVKDIREILPVWGELADFHSALDPAFAPSESWPREYGAYLRTLMTRDDAIAVVARDGADLIGYAVGRLTTLPPFFEHRHRGYIHDVYVKPAFRRHGVGRGLVQEILAWLRRRGVAIVELTVAVNNDAIPFWERLGFHVYMHHMKLELRDQQSGNREQPTGNSEQY